MSSGGGGGTGAGAGAGAGAGTSAITLATHHGGATASSPGASTLNPHGSTVRQGERHGQSRRATMAARVAGLASGAPAQSSQGAVVKIHPDSGRMYYVCEEGDARGGAGDVATKPGPVSCWEAPGQPSALYERFEEAGYGLVDAVKVRRLSLWRCAAACGFACLSVAMATEPVVCVGVVAVSWARSTR